MKILVIAIVALVGIGQGAKKPEFEVATVRVAPLAQLVGDRININLGTVRNGKVTLGNVTLSDCIKFAYGIVSDSQIVGPDWIKRGVRYEIVAQAPPDTPQEQLLQMMQTLLAERLKLTIHHEQRELSFLALVVAKNGPKLLPAENAAGPAITGAGRISTPRMPMDVLAMLLSRFERQIVVDRTELKGPFSVKLQWTTDAIRNLATPDGAPVLINGQSFDGKK